MDNAKISGHHCAKISGHHWKIMFISGMGFFTDAYDLMAWNGLLAAESAAAIASVCGLVLTIFTTARRPRARASKSFPSGARRPRSVRQRNRSVV